MCMIGDNSRLALVATADWAETLIFEPISHVFLVSAVGAYLAPDIHAGNWKLTYRASGLMSLAVRAKASNTFSLLRHAVRTD
jgi:hypothetical protein